MIMKYEKLNNCVDQLIKTYNDKLIDIIENYPGEITNFVLDALKESVQETIKPKEINNIHDLAKLLNNNDRRNELDNPYNINVKELCKKNKWIVLFPYSDDYLEIRGYIDDEVSAWEGGNYKILKKDDFYKDEEKENTYHRALQNMIYPAVDENPGIFMKWCPDSHPNYTWWIETNYNYEIVAYFNIIDEDDKEDNIWARCCIIDCSLILN